MKTHGETGTRLYTTWKGMKYRCSNPRVDSYKNYGGRGISVCARWEDFSNFKKDMGEPPEGMSIDRINNDAGYFPGNCRWATPEQQQRNRVNNTKLTFSGRTLCLVEWAAMTGIRPSTIGSRIKRGWSIADTLSIKTGQGRKIDLTAHWDNFARSLGRKAKC